MRVEEGPDKLPADVFEAELKMSVLENGVMATIESGCADVEALLVGDFFRSNQMRGVAGAGSGDGRVERMRKSVAQSYARETGFDRFILTRSIEHSGLCGHLGDSFYTGGEKRKVESREQKRG